MSRLYEASSKTRVILSERSESKNLRTEGQRCRNDNAKILRLRTSCFAQDDRDFRELVISSPHPTSLCSATFPQGKACRGRPLGRPTIKPSKEGVGEAFRLPRADDIRPYEGIEGAEKPSPLGRVAERERGRVRFLCLIHRYAVPLPQRGRFWRERPPDAPQ